MGLEGGVSSLGVEGRNYGGVAEIEMRDFRFVPQIYGGGICSLCMSRITPPNGGGSCAQYAEGIGFADQCRHLLICALDWLLQPVLFDSTTSSCCCTASSNFCVAMSEHLCSNPWRNNFVEGKIGDHPSKTTQE